MKVKNLDTTLVKLPASIEFTLFLLREELKSSTLLNNLSKVGFDDSHYRSDFSSAVLESIGFKNQTDEVHELYFTLVNNYSKKIKEGHTKIMKHAFNLYVDLVIEQRKRSSDQ